MNILVWLPTRVGDSIHSIPFLRALEQLFPAAVIDVIARESLVELVELYPGIDHIYTFSKKEYKGLAGKYRFARMAAAQKPYDVYFTLSESFTSALIGFFTGIKTRIGRNTEYRRLLLTHPLKHHRYTHNVDNFMGILAAYAPAAKDLQPQYTLTPGADLSGRTLLPAGRNLVLCLYGTTTSRHVPQAKAVDLIKFLLREYDYNILLVGIKSDQERLSGVLAEVGPNERIHNFAGKTGLRELTAVIQQADFVLSVDSGPAHLANCLGRKLVVLFGQGDERIIGPYSLDKARALRVPGLSCAPCHQNVCPLGDVRCLTRIRNDMIARAMEELEG